MALNAKLAYGEPKLVVLSHDNKKSVLNEPLMEETKSWVLLASNRVREVGIELKFIPPCL